jgi:Cdc6-like AAA superfamily ATPase
MREPKANSKSITTTTTTFTQTELSKPTMLSYDPPMPANQGHKDTPNVLTGTNGAVNTYIPSSKPNGLSNGVSTVNKAPASSQKHHHIWLVTGPAGCGKTTIAQYLASQLNLPYIEGDSVCRTQMMTIDDNLSC